MLGSNIRKIRKQQGLSINKLSEISGVSLGYLSDLENGKMTNPSDRTIEALSDVLGVTPDYLRGLSIRYIITERLEALKMPLTELCAQTGLSEKYFHSLDDVIPEPEDYENRLTKIAEVLSIPKRLLIVAMARQEPPAMGEDGYVYHDPRDDFDIVNEDGGDYSPSSKDLICTALGYNRYKENWLKNRETLAAFRTDGYDDPLSEDEATAVKTFLETYRKMKGGKNE